MRKLPGKIDGELITREFFPKYVGNEGDINNGHCYRWAYVAYKLYAGVRLYSNPGHAFPRQRGKFFDSESPKGEKRLEYLHCNSAWERTADDCFEQSEDEFIRFWNEHGRYKFADVEDLDKRIRSFWRKHDREIEKKGT